jgi:hypothetical protein
MENVSFNKDNMLEVTLKEPDDFLKVRETLSRIGVASRKEKKLYQSCHILHKQGKYYIGLINISSEVQNMSPLSQIKIISFKEKSEWTLETKYNIGKTKDENSI